MTRYEAQIDRKRAAEYGAHPDPNDPEYPGWNEPPEEEVTEEEPEK
jgi:hypothetical protein